MQRGQDHLQRRLVAELRMRVDGDAAAVVAHCHPVVGGKLQLDAGGVAGHRLVHGIVQDLGDQMVQRPLVGAADIHARAPAHRLQPLQDLDVGGGVVSVVAGRWARWTRSCMAALYAACG
jgi:hypothetical protein